MEPRGVELSAHNHWKIKTISKATIAVVECLCSNFSRPGNGGDNYFLSMGSLRIGTSMYFGDHGTLVKASMRLVSGGTGGTGRASERTTITTIPISITNASSTSLSLTSYQAPVAGCPVAECAVYRQWVRTQSGLVGRFSCCHLPPCTRSS